MVRRGDQEGAGFLSTPVRRGNNGIRAPTHPTPPDTALNSLGFVLTYGEKWRVQWLSSSRLDRTWKRSGRSVSGPAKRPAERVPPYPIGTSLLVPSSANTPTV